MAEVNMPKLSDTMEEGTVLEWKKEDGAEVRRGEVLAEIESDKASFEIEAEADGVLHIVVARGEAVPVGQLIARIGGAAPARAPAPAAAPEPPPKAEAPPAAAAPPAPAPAPARPADNGAGRLKVSPLARRLAEQMGIDLTAVRGTGPAGRIVKDDVLALSARPGLRPAGAGAPPPAAARPPVEVEEPTRMQATIARRMAESTSTVPHFYLTVEARVDEAVRVRRQLKELVPGAGQVTMTDMLARACAIALTRFPEVNASWVDGRFERRRAVSIGLAVPPAQGMGLLVPVVHDVDRKDLVQISIEARQVIERARSGKPAPGDLEGATFSISNLGMYGVDEFTAIINPPESAILAVGAIRDAPVIEDGQVRAGKVMRMTLSVDHRVFYGATAARFMAELRGLLESPVALLVPPGA